MERWDASKMTVTDSPRRRRWLQVTCFVALQDVTLDMGPTIMVPRRSKQPGLKEMPTAVV